MHTEISGQIIVIGIVIVIVTTLFIILLTKISHKIQIRIENSLLYLYF